MKEEKKVVCYYHRDAAGFESDFEFLELIHKQ